MRIFSRCCWLHRADRRAGRLCPCWKELGAIAEAAHAGLFRAPQLATEPDVWPPPWINVGTTVEGSSESWEAEQRRDHDDPEWWRSKGRQLIGRVHGVPERLLEDHRPRPVVTPDVVSSGGWLQDRPSPTVTPEEQAPAYGPTTMFGPLHWIAAIGSVGVLVVVVVYVGWALGWWPL